MPTKPRDRGPLQRGEMPLFRVGSTTIVRGLWWCGYALPWSCCCGRLCGGHEIPVEGIDFPEYVASMIELERPSVLNALARIERCDRAAQHVGGDAEATCAGLQLEVNSGSRTERARPLNERAARAQIDEGHRIARPEDCVRSGDGRLAKSRVLPTIN